MIIFLKEYNFEISDGKLQQKYDNIQLSNKLTSVLGYADYIRQVESIKIIQDL
jgi:hypothetical protein